MYNLESDEFNSINNQDHYLCGNILPILEKFKLKHFIENYNEEKEIIEIQNKSYQLSQEIDIKSIGNNQNLMHPKNSINNNNNAIINKQDENIFNKLKLINNNKSNEQNNRREGGDKKKEKRIIKFIKYKETKERLYRKDYYYKYFKSLFGKYLRNKTNYLKNSKFSF